MSKDKSKLNAEGFIPGQDINFNDLMTHYARHSEMVDTARELSAQKLSQREDSLRRKSASNKKK